MLPSCIILDESTAMLDPMGRRDVIEIIERLNKELGITIINITHYMDEAARAERVVVINGGSILFDDKPKAVFSNVDDLHKIGLDVPQGVELVNALLGSGLNISTDVLTPEECVDAIIKAISEITD
jgi:energy-coupling factor transport system ATP-binding protein